MHEAALAGRKGSGVTGRQAYGRPDRFALINSLARWRGRYSWFALPALVVWLAFWIAAGPRDNIPEILGGVFLLAIHASILLRQRGLDDPEQNFVELTEEYIRIQEFMGMAIRVAYADIAAVRPATKIPLLRRGFVMIPKRDVPSYFEIVLRKPRWRGPFRLRRLFFRPAEPTQFDFALRARLDRIGRWGAEPAS